MQVFRDAAAVLVLVLLVSSVRIGAPDGPGIGSGIDALTPEVHAAEPALPLDSPGLVLEDPVRDPSVAELECGAPHDATLQTVHIEELQPERLSELRELMRTLEIKASATEDRVMIRSGGDDPTTFSFDIELDSKRFAPHVLRLAERLASANDT